MTFRRSTLFVVALFGLVGPASNAHAAGFPAYTVVPGVTDPGIVDTVPTRGNHLIGVPDRPVGRLLVFLPTGGPTNVPSEFSVLGTEATRLGYHTIILAYRNEAPIAAAPTATPPGCGNLPDPPATPPDCAFNIRQELLDGTNWSPVVDVNRANSIENRLNKLLTYLATTPAHAGEGWAGFQDAGGEPKWPETVIAGSSLGAGEAAIIAERHLVYRASLLHGWTDAKHGWVKRGATPSSRYFTLIHQRDAFYARTCYAYVALGLWTACPVDPAKVVLVDNLQPPFETQVHVFNLEPGSFAGTGDWYHQSTSRDGWIAREPDGTPSKKLVNAWRSVLGDSDADTILDEVDNCPKVANVEQIDSDSNRVGDACGPTLRTGTLGGSVPATLALTLGPTVSLGAFAPGVDRTYEASTTATVISTAGDAELAVADSGAVAPGRLVNGAFSLSEPLEAKAGATFAALGAAPVSLVTYPAPVSNAAATITFRQHISQTQALRTGAYSKTLTFTLSTTTP